MSRFNIHLHQDYAPAEARRTHQIRKLRAVPGVNRGFASSWRPAAAIVAVLGELASLALSVATRGLRR
jgi:hypothetical protein